MCGGDEAVFEKVRPLFEKMGKNVTLVGGNGDGQTTKVANQIIVALTIAAVGEALLFASKAGADPAKELEDMRWLAEIVSGATELPLSFDSAQTQVLEAGLQVCNRPGTIINSTTAESARLADTLPLVKKYNTGIIALTMNDAGMPETLAGRQTIVD